MIIVEVDFLAAEQRALKQMRMAEIERAIINLVKSLPYEEFEEISN